MHDLLERLLANGPVVTDGAWGTQIQALGLASGESPDGWNLKHPDRVGTIPLAYVNAGSHVVITNTFRGNRFALATEGLADQAAALNRAGAEISKQAAGEDAVVFGSIGPSGKMLCMNEVSSEDLRAAFVEQAAALAAGGADGLVIETMADLEEAVLAVEAALQTGLPVIACMCFDSGADSDRTMMGVTPEQAAERLVAAGAHGIGANCGQGVEGYIKIGKRFAAATDVPIWIKANAGLPKVVDGEVVYDITATEFADKAMQLADVGVSFIGGCCGTSPEFISELSSRLEK